MNHAVRLALALLVATPILSPALRAETDPKAVEKARAKVAENEADAGAQLELADALLAANEPEDAWTALEKAIEKNPKDGRLNLKLGDVFIVLAQKEAARPNADGTTVRNFFLDAGRMYDKALEKEPRMVEAVYGKAFVAFQNNETEDARKLVAECLDIQKDFARAHALQAQMFYNESKFGPAADAYEIALKLDKSEPVDFVRLGHCYARLNQPAKAQHWYTEVLKHHPDYDVSIRSGLVNMLAEKQYAKAAPYLKAATDAAPESPVAWFHYGFSLYANNMNEEALAAFKKAADLRPKNPQYFYYAGLACEKLNDGKKALDYYRKALKLNPNYNEPALQFEGLAVSNRASNFGELEKLMEELLTLAPNHGWIRNDYALLLRDWAEQRGAAKAGSLPADVKKRIQRSSEVYEEAAALLPDSAQVQSDTGLLFEFYPAIFDAEKAQKYFVRSLELSEFTYRDAWSGLYRLLQRTKNWELLRDCAEGVLGALEDSGRIPVAPVGGAEPQEVPNDKPRMIAQAKQAIALADAALAKSGKKGGG